MVRLTARGFGADDAGRRQRQRGRAGARTGGSSSPWCRRRRRRRRRRTGRGGGREPADAAEADAARRACAAEIDAILAERSIQFAAGSATLRRGERPGDRGDRARRCAAAPTPRFEIGGHTDSQGSDSGNLRLSQERAEAVLAALRAEGLPLAGGRSRRATARPSRSPTTPPPRGGRRTGASPSRRSPSEAGAGGGGRRAGGRTRPAWRRIGGDPRRGARSSSPPASAEHRARERGGASTRSPAALRGCPDVAMEIGGHTDSEGSESGNERLSQRRAEAVLAALARARTWRCRT